jgi:anhydro-N-acetylmuramic acid kinase
VLLFREYDACLNLGGFANISYIRRSAPVAFDICPCNTILNHAAGWLHLPFDDRGKIAASGTVHPELLNQLNSLSFYTHHGAKSLGKEWVNMHFWPVAATFEDLSEADTLATFAEHIAYQVAAAIRSAEAQQVLITGGGAFNDHLIRLIGNKVSARLIIPGAEIVQFKEALIFAFLGVLRITNTDNCLASVTGAKHNNIGGAIYGKMIPR